MSITEFDTETPMHMIEPMNDSMFSVVPVISSMIATPQTTPGTAADGNQAQPERLEIAGQQDQDHDDRQSPGRWPSEWNISASARPGRGRSTRTPRGGRRRRRWPARLCAVARPRSSPFDVGGDAQVALHGACGRSRRAWCRLPRWPRRGSSGCISGPAFSSGIVSTCCGRFIRWMGTWTWTW